MLPGVKRGVRTGISTPKTPQKNKNHQNTKTNKPQPPKKKKKKKSTQKKKQVLVLVVNNLPPNQHNHLISERGNGRSWELKRKLQNNYRGGDGKGVKKALTLVLIKMGRFQTGSDVPHISLPKRERFSSGKDSSNEW